MKLVRLIANLGYGSRKQVALMFREGRITDPAGDVLYADDKRDHADIRVDGEPLDPAPGICLMLNKPTGVTCSTRDVGRVVYDLLPARFRARDPVLSTVGRLDRDTSGLLLMTDDGALLHKLTSPKHNVPKVYEATVKHPLTDKMIESLMSGVVLDDDPMPVRAEHAEIVSELHLRMSLTQGKYHQVKRMVAAVGNRVEALHRSQIGRLTIPEDLAPGQWRWLDDASLVLP